MKSVIFFGALALLFASTQAAHVLTPRNSDDMLNHLQGNSYNIYLLFFYQPNPIDEVLRTTNNDIERLVQSVLEENPDIMYAKIDESNQEFSKLFNVVGVTVTPAILLIVHGKGVWISGTNTRLMVERIRDFIPAFKQAASHHTSPY